MQYFNLHTHKFTNSSDILELVNQYPWEFDETMQYYSIGIHPWYIDENRLANDLKIIEEKLQKKECLALGECGLDKRIDIALSVQIEVFKKQILLAEHYQKPLVLHLVAAYDELIEIKNQMKISVPIVIHGFSKNQQIAKQLLNNGFYLSFGKYLLKNPDLESVFKLVPNNRFFLETDTIDGTIDEIYALAAKYKGIEVKELVEIINNNVDTFFNKN